MLRPAGIGTAAGGRGAPTLSWAGSVPFPPPCLPRTGSPVRPALLPALPHSHGNFPSPILNTALFPLTADPFSNSSLSSQTIPAQPRRAPGQGGTRPCRAPVQGMCSPFPEHSPSWGHLGDPPAPQERLSPTPEQPRDTMGPRSPATVASCRTSVIKTWYFACQEQLLRAKSCNAFWRSKPLIPLTSLARTCTGQGLMQTQTAETTFEIKKVYLQICKTALLKTNISKHYEMRMHFSIIRI